MLGGGCRHLTADFLVTTPDSFFGGIKMQNREIMEWADQADLLLGDECHHLAAYSWSMIANHLHRAKFRYGLTPCLWDDPYEPAVEDFTVVGMLGPAVAKIPTSYLSEKGYLASTHVSVVHIHYPVVRGGMWHQIYNDGIAKHRQRNGIILSLASQLYNAGRKVLVLVWRKAHGWRLIQALSHMGYPAEFVRGGGCADTHGPGGWATRNLTIDQLTREYRDKDRYLLVLSSVGDEGFNLPEIDVVIIGSSMKKHRRTIQRIGRGMRVKAGENAVYIFDFIDAHNTSLHRQSMRRVGTYQYEGHPVYVGLDSARQRLGLPLDVSVIPKIPNYTGGPGKED
jgi:superfamily II DNA or RNA helicase